MAGEYKTSLTPEHRKFLEDLFRDGVSFDPKVLRVYASDASLVTGSVLAMARRVALHLMRLFGKRPGGAILSPMARPLCAAAAGVPFSAGTQAFLPCGGLPTFLIRSRCKKRCCSTAQDIASESRGAF